MSSLTIRNLEPETKDRLRRRATSHGRSMQDEAKQILQSVLAAPAPAPGRTLYERIRARVEPIGGIDIEVPERPLARDPPTFE